MGGAFAEGGKSESQKVQTRRRGNGPLKKFFFDRRGKEGTAVVGGLKVVHLLAGRGPATPGVEKKRKQLPLSTLGRRKLFKEDGCQGTPADPEPFLGGKESAIFGGKYLERSRNSKRSTTYY